MASKRKKSARKQASEVDVVVDQAALIEEMEKAKEAELKSVRVQEDQILDMENAVQLEQADLQRYMAALNKRKWWQAQIQAYEAQLEVLRLRFASQSSNLQRQISGIKTALKELEDEKIREIVDHIERKYGVTIDQNTVIDEDTGLLTTVQPIGKPKHESKIANVK